MATSVSTTREGAQRIFISYRRDDTQWVAGRLGDSLGAYFGDSRVFRDVEGIAGGADFGEVIRHTLGSADAVVVLIGPDWLSASDDRGHRRLDDADDWVCHEVSAALEAGVPVYPVLVEGNEAERRLAFADSYRMLKNRISAFIALPIASLDRLSLRNKLDEIGTLLAGNHHVSF